MVYAEATALGKIRAMAAYMGIMVWDGLDDGTVGQPVVDDQAKWFGGTFTEEDAKRVLPEWEKEMDELCDDWMIGCEIHYRTELANGSVEPADPTRGDVVITIE